jgi:pyruvate ferredoxin oxidoreductase gamma subunit
VVQVRLHGRGGQGVVTAAEILSVAAFLEGKFAQAFPSFGSERMGAPVASYCRIDDKPIRSREPVIQPDVIIIQDPTLLHDARTLEGLAPNGYMLLNSSRPLEQVRTCSQWGNIPLGHLCTIPATEIAQHHLNRPLPNSSLLGGLAALTSLVQLESISAAIRSKFAGTIGERNAAAAAEAFAFVRENTSWEGK